MFKRNMFGRYEVWPDPYAIALGRMFRRARRLAGLSQDKVEAGSGISQSVISRFERGLAPGMTTERLIRIASVVGLSFPFGFCPHTDPHPCPWPVIAPVPYDHPPAKPKIKSMD
jgi:transcriptional regulator with XRE-family HTH domain